MTDFASNPVYVGPLPAQSVEYEGEPSKVEMTAAQRANGFVPELPVAAEHLNFELNALTASDTAQSASIATNAADIATLAAQLEANALSNFTEQTSGTVENLNDVCWDATTAQFIAVGTNGVIFTSPGGRVWTSRTSGVVPPNSINGVGSKTTIIVAVADGGAIITSPDGITWTPRTSGTGNNLIAVSWVPFLSRFIAVGLSGTLLTSPDGITWTVQASGAGASRLDCIGVSPAMAYVGGLGGLIRRSTNGTTWSSAGFSALGTIGLGLSYDPALDRMIYIGGAGGRLVHSIGPLDSDFPGWIDAASGTTQPLQAIVYTGQNHFIVGQNVSLLSRNTTNWLNAHGDAVYDLNGVAWNGSVAVMVGDGGKILNSHRVGSVV